MLDGRRVWADVRIFLRANCFEALAQALRIQVSSAQLLFFVIAYSCSRNKLGCKLTDMSLGVKYVRRPHHQCDNHTASGSSAWSSRGDLTFYTSPFYPWRHSTFQVQLYPYNPSRIQANSLVRFAFDPGLFSTAAVFLNCMMFTQNRL